MTDPALALMIDAVREAGAIALEHLQGDLGTVQKPGGAGPVTAADLAVDAHLHARLLGAAPDHGWLSEETPDTPDRLSRREVFVVDPIDGTRAYAERSRDWAISVARVVDGVPRQAVVFAPARDAMFTAHEGGGTHLNGAPVSVSGATTCEASTCLTQKPTMDPTLWSRPPGFTRHFRSSLALRLAMAAQGRFDAMITLRPTWEWDVAAGVLLVAQAGGRVTDRHSAAPRFNSPERWIDGILAGPAALVEDIRARLAP
ncbi:MAG: 3'(2'),5'-bisphosphate nucleotidase CysQ [Paracoccaceae bacterium]